MTEAEAKALYCPHIAPEIEAVRVSDAQTETTTTRVIRLAKCQAALCMMWRWNDSQPGHGHCGMAPL